MSKKHLKLEPHQKFDNWWWYEDNAGIIVVINNKWYDYRTTGLSLLPKNAQFRISWKELRNALARKDKK